MNRRAGASAAAACDTEDDGTCGICFSAMDAAAGDSSKLSGCEHRFHDGCAAEWADTLREKNKEAACPVCREPFDKPKV